MNSLIKVKTHAVAERATREGLSFAALARKAGVSVSCVHLIMTEKRTPSPATARKICTALNANFDDLFVYEGGQTSAGRNKDAQ